LEDWLDEEDYLSNLKVEYEKKLKSIKDDYRKKKMKFL
jgi:hypothetical protein